MSVSDIEADHYRRWIKAINTCLHKKLGGDEPSDASGLSFGEGRFQFDLVNDAGEVRYTIDLPKHPRHSTTFGGPFKWRAFQPSDVCAELINVYEQLLRDSELNGRANG